MDKKFDFKSVTGQFCLYGDFVSAAPYGNGHINDTFEVIFDQAGARMRYILQRINTNVFRDPVNLMENIRRVTSHLAAKSENSRQTLTLVPAVDGKSYVIDAEGNYFRTYLFIENAKSYAAQGLARVLMQEDMTAQTMTDGLLKLLDEKDQLLKTLTDYPVKDGTDAVLKQIQEAQK